MKNKKQTGFTEQGARRVARAALAHEKQVTKAKPSSATTTISQNGFYARITSVHTGFSPVRYSWVFLQPLAGGGFLPRQDFDAGGPLYLDAEDKFLITTNEAYALSIGQNVLARWSIEQPYVVADPNYFLPTYCNVASDISCTPPMSCISCEPVTFGSIQFGRNVEATELECDDVYSMPRPILVEGYMSFGTSSSCGMSEAVTDDLGKYKKIEIGDGLTTEEGECSDNIVIKSDFTVCSSSPVTSINFGDCFTCSVTDCEATVELDSESVGSTIEVVTGVCCVSNTIHTSTKILSFSPCGLYIGMEDGDTDCSEEE